ncbi:KID-containing protein 1-like [Mercurialis annua]|uniref:KID-containing protein 1-like n=1 Tax=Mercurialis annua TaxID=3986 RepID=UPI00215DFAA3|nr:KID-containing protein 1-like [Mercurialis annua]
MEVLVGPTFSIEVSSPSQDLHHHHGDSASASSHTRVFLEDGQILGQDHRLISSRIGSGLGRPNHELDEDEDDDTSTDGSSSIGDPDDSDLDDDDEADSGGSIKGALGSLDSLEDSLPIKRGLSNHFAGKSKSFTNLSEVLIGETTVKDLVKTENPFNKRRRVLMANKYGNRRKASFYSWSNPKSMPLLSLPEEEQLQDYEDDEDNKSSSSTEPDHHLQLSKLQDRRFKPSFKSHSCFNLADLEEEDDDEEYL